MSKKRQKAQLLLPAHDAHLFSAGYSPEYQRQSRLVFLLSELWDEERQQHTCAHVEFRRVAAVCSNVGVATVVRIRPELADHEHLYYENLHEGGDARFDEAYERAYARYFSQLRRAEPELPSDASDEDRLSIESMEL